MPRIPTRWPKLTSAVLTALGLLFAASPVLLAGEASSTAPTNKTRTWTVKVGGQTSSGAVQTMAYGAKEIWINVGDKVRWRAASLEPHTVSFVNDAHPAVPFDPSISYMTTRTKQDTISRPGQFRSSGIMALAADPVFPAVSRTYDLTFLKVGTYKYLCYLHGHAMMGVVHVRKAGTAYPHTQAEYNLAAARARNAELEHGISLWAAALGAADAHHVFAGAADMTAMVNRFIPGSTTVKVGESVTFDLARNMFPVPHTVTFGPPPADPLAPAGDRTNYQGGPLSSGLLLPPGFGPPGSSSFTVTFTKAGTYSYVCLLHSGMGMVGQVVVQ